MSRLNGKQIAKAKRLVAERDGIQCHACNRKPGDPYKDKHGIDRTTYLELDHIDDDAYNNPPDGANWQLLCVPCNRVKSAKDKPRGQKFQRHKRLKITQEKKIRRLKGTAGERLLFQYAIMAKNINAEPIVVEFFERTIDKMETVTLEDLVNAAAQEVTIQTNKTISQQAVKGYLAKRTNPINGVYEQVFDHVLEEMVVRRRTNGKDKGTEAERN